MSLHLSMPRPRLLVRMIADDTGRTVPLLTDADGVPMPMQRRVSLAYDHEGRAEVTVTFAVDGDDIQLVPDRFEALV
jgi:hypothetical protein